MRDFERSRRHWLVLLLSAAISSIAAGQGTLVYYEGGDPGALTPLPNSDAAAASFDLAATQLGTGVPNALDFEAAPLGMFTTLNESALGVAGVSIGPAGGNNGDDAKIANVNAVLEGFNTTSGGTHFLQIEEAGSGEPSVGVTISFADPIVAFGSYFTGMDDALQGAVRAVFDDGTVHDLQLTENTLGGGQFWGFTTDDPSSSITSVTIMVDPEFNAVSGIFENNDVIGLDDIRWVLAIPEPSGALLVALAAVLLWLRRPRD